jgi:hypothetical protein
MMNPQWRHVGNEANLGYLRVDIVIIIRSGISPFEEGP